jgi:uncharacterized protein (TIGR03790 family)
MLLCLRHLSHLGRPLRRRHRLRHPISAVARCRLGGAGFWIIALACLGAASPVLALEPDELVLVVNRNEPAGVELAGFYARQRGVPPGRILPLDIPAGEEISFADYESNVVPAVRAWLVSRGLSEQVKCLVSFYGLPLRIAARINTAADNAERANLQQRMVRMQAEMAAPVGRLESLARQLNPAYTAGKATTFAQLVEAANNAARVIQDQAALMRKSKQEQTLAQMYLLLEPLLGDEAKLRRMMLQQSAQTASDAESPATAPERQAADAQAPSAQDISDFRANYQRQVLTAERLEQQRYDPAGRELLRQLVSSRFGMLQYVRLLSTQLDYLNPTDTSSAFDSELSLVRWVSYSHVRWRENPLFYAQRDAGRTFAPTYMVMRLDAPQPEQVRKMITDAIDAEGRGLSGQVVLDSRGLNLATAGSGPDAGLAQCDSYIRNLGQLLRAHTKLPVLEDDKPAVLPPNSAKNVAIYCGWYSLRAYVPECQFNPGAVGFHIASYELVSLHNPGEPGWVAGLINHGVAGTLGAVAEPYVQAFPRPDDFFPLLLCGKLSLAEVYWDTVPMTSWMISCIGDPLYTPYRKNAPLAVTDLPDRLQPLFTARPDTE